ncbi:MAG: rod shape-determining protein MreC [Candidatus Binataceae bacterium]
MRGTFLWRHRVVLTSGLLLLLALHLLSAGVAPGARAEKPSLALMWMLKPVQNLEANIADDTSGFFHDYFDLVNVRGENAELRKQVAVLEGQRTRLAELEVENRHLSDLLELRDALAMRAVAARVIGADATEQSRTLILSAGSRGGLRRDLPVVSTEGVVGKLIAVAPNVSRVLLINDHNSGLDAFDQRSRARGIIAGLLNGELTMKYVDRSEDVKPGDAVVTSGMDGIFPRGLLVGQVTRVSQEGPGLFLNVDIRPAANFRKLEQVLILTQQPPEIAPDFKG